MTADLEAVTRTLAPLFHEHVCERPCGMACQPGYYTVFDLTAARKAAAVLAALPDDRLAEAEAKAWDACAEWCYYDGLFDMTTLTERVESANPYRAALSGGDAP